MTDPALFRLRVTFVEKGRLALLSHLELARALERAVRRADLPFAVSRGFSPHMRIAFGAALPVGVGGTCELFDLLLVRYVPPARALAALQAASVPDLMPFSCEYVEHTAPAASVAFPVSSYRARLSRAPRRLLLPEQVRVVRKKKDRTLAVGDYLLEAPRLEGETLDFTLVARQSGSLRPDVLLRETLALSSGGDAPQRAADAGGVLLAVEDATGAAAAEASGAEAQGGPDVRVVGVMRVGQRAAGERERTLSGREAS